MYYMYLVDRLGGPEPFAAAAAREGSFEAESFVRAGEIIQEFVEMGAFVEGYNGLDYDTGQSRVLLYAGQAAMELIGSWNIQTVKAENEAFFENMGFFPFPAIEEGEGDPSTVVGTVGDSYYHIASSCDHPEEAFEFLTYLLDEQSIDERLDAGRIPPIAGVSEMLDEPLSQEIMRVVEDAAGVQLWYDQYLPVELGEVHKDTMQALFGMAITPEEAAAAQEEATADYYEE
jgi:raffinose/stachyose/melibiose transport system substrate-binding protein